MIRRRRETLGWSQKKLADQLSLSQSLVSTWEGSTAVPSLEHVRDLARVLEMGERQLTDAREVTEIRSAARPRTIDAILNDAAEFLADHSCDLWLLGPNHLPVLESGGARDAWLENLQQGISYRLLWLLDAIAPQDLKTALPHFAQIAEDAAQRGSSGDAELGRIKFLALNSSTKDVPAISTYERFSQAAGDESLRNQPLDIQPYIPLEKWEGSFRPEVAAVRAATEEVIRIWQPDTSIILYQPKSLLTPPVANIRLMPVTERIHTKDGEPQRPMYWLTPDGAARVSHVIANLEEALGALTLRIESTEERRLP